MKDSGVEWIGEIPEDWEIVKLKFLTELISKGISPNYTEEKLSPVVNQATFSKGYFDYNLKYCSDELKGEGLLEKDDVLLATTGGGVLGKTFYFQEDKKYLASTDVAYLRCKSQEISKFIYYILSINYGLLNGEYAKGSTNQTHLQMDSLSNMKIPSPPENKLKEIINKGDYSTKVIDGDIAIIENQLSVLEAYKKSVITEAVTKGLDKNAEMKDSGVEWIGEIPKHWRKSKVKRLCSVIGSGATPTSNNTEFYIDEDIHWIQSGDLYKTPRIRATEKRISKSALQAYSTLKLYKSPFIVIAMYGASVGNVSLSEIDATTNQACCVLKENDETDLMYLYYWISFAKEDLLRKAEGGSQPNISQDKIKNQIMCFPPLKEQRLIANYLDKKTQAIDEGIAMKQNQLSLLDEYKKSLIYEYVTGKREV